MPIASKLNQHFHKHGIDCQPIHHARCNQYQDAISSANIEPKYALKAVALLDRRGPALAVIPYLAELRVEQLNQSLNRQFQVLEDIQAAKLFKDCEPGILPVFGMAYGLPVLIDADVLDFEHCFMRCGCSSTLLKMQGKTLRMSMTGAIKIRACDWPDSQSALRSMRSANDASTVQGMSLDDVAKKLQHLYKLPPMPATAVRVMHLVADPDSDAAQLAELVERDPSLSAQIMKYARSALFSYRGELTSIKDAINIVLGFDRVSKLAMGIAASKAFVIPSEGPLGLTKFWQHALYCGVLNQALALLADPELALDDKDAYLTGLLHNFGLLLIGHLFPPEFKMLNKLRETEPEEPMSVIEQQIFGIGGAQEFISLGHGAIGAILLRMWSMPETTVKVAAMHQNLTYKGDFEAEVKLCQLSNYLLAQQGVGDEPMDIDPTSLYEALKIPADKAKELAELTIEQCRSLDGLIDSM